MGAVTKEGGRRPMSYGEMMAHKRSIRRVELEERAAEREYRPVGSRSPRNVAFDPALGDEVMPGIRWEANAGIAEGICDRLSKSVFVLVNMPTGTGKTACAVAAIGELQRREGCEIPFAVVAPRSVIDGRGWHKTVNAWNEAHPDNRVRMVLCESHAKFTGVLNNGQLRHDLLTRLGARGVVVLDEAHAYKTPTSKRSKSLAKLGHIRRIGLSATPFTNDAVVDGVSYLIVGRRFNSKTQFFKMSGLDQTLDMYYKPCIYTDGEVDERKWPYYPKFRRMLSKIVYTPEVDVSDMVMPNLRSFVRTVEFDQELVDNVRSIYEAHKRGAFDSMIDVAMCVVATIGESRTRLAQLRDIITQPGVVQPLIFYWNMDVLDVLVSNLREWGFEPQIVSGSHKFSNVDLDSDEPVLIQYQAGSEGIEFKRSNVTVFYQNQSSFSCLKQSIGRNVRRGCDHDVRHYSLVSQVSFDRRIFERLRECEEISDAVLSDIVSDGMREFGIEPEKG